MRVLICSALALALLSGRAAGADPSKRFIEARTVFRSGQYQEAALRFSGLLYPKSQLTDGQQEIDAHVHLAAASFEIGKLDSAANEFEEALNLDPTLDISTYQFSTEATRFFEKKKSEFDEKIRKEAEKHRRARERQRALELVARIRIQERKNYLFNLIPFGFGQFQNNQPRKGLAFAAAQVGLGATSFVIYSYLQGRYPDGRVPLTEVDAARRLQVFQITSATACIGVMAWGVIDAFLNYSEEARPLTEQEKKEYVDELLREEREESKESSLRLTPMITPDGAGAALSWEF